MAVAGCEAIEANRRGEILGLRLGNGPSVLGLSKIDLLKDVRGGRCQDDNSVFSGNVGIMKKKKIMVL